MSQPATANDELARAVAESKVCYARGVYHPRSFQFYVPSVDMIEQTETFVEQFLLMLHWLV